jgi:lysophospholipase L1-like esterase
MVAMPTFDRNDPVCCQRRDIVRRTYDNAVAHGDQRVYHVESELLFGTKDRDACTVDGCHPNDLGFMRMAENIYPAVQRALIESGQM